MTVLSFRKIIANIFIFVTLAGILYSIVKMISNKPNENNAEQFVIYSVIFAVSYYFGYVYSPLNSVFSSNNVSSSENACSVQDKDSKKEEERVFNISQNIYRYSQADKVCEKMGAKLATVSQLKDAYNKGANWCNYGWTQGGYALYPIQPDYFDMIQNSGKRVKEKDGKYSDHACKWKCGSKPGLVGGRMNGDMTFGINCYGVPPKNTIKNVLPCQNQENEKNKSKIQYYIENQTPEVLAFN